MKRTFSAMAVASLGLALTLSGCGSDDADNPGGGGDAKPKVGVILPDSKSSPRWENTDRPALEAAFKAAGVDYDIQNAEGKADNMTRIADGMIASGVAVIALVNIDSPSAAAIEQKADAQGIKTLDYDRLTLSGSAAAYISYDNVKVGELQGEGLAGCLGDKPSNIIYLKGSPDDNNATLFAQGAHKVLDANTKYKNVAEQAVPGWDSDKAVTIFDQLYTKAKGKVDGVLAANDTLASSAISVLEKYNLDGKVPVTGQDATPQGLQNILAGTQCMTVFKSSVAEAQALADSAIALTKGEEPKTTGTVDDAGKAVPAVILDPVVITKDNIATEIAKVFADGAVTYADVCKDNYKAMCDKAGIKQ